jgi:biotin synthase
MNLSRKEINELRVLSGAELMQLALQTKLKNRGDKFSLCSIINAKSGKCSEDCRFCAQSAHYETEAPVYPLKSEAEITAAAAEAKQSGAQHFSLVTSGRGLPSKEIPAVAKIITTITNQVQIPVCASLGILSKKDLAILKEAGLKRYHHNLETSREFFPQIVSTHTFEERLETIKAAQDVGLEVCAGGIIGLGESEDDRISMAISLRDCEVDSVPLNVLIPLPGTPLANHTPITPAEILRTIALFRLIHPTIPIRLAAGRESALGDFLSSAFMAGADGMMIGGYLTQRGRYPEEDLTLVREIQTLWNG